MEIFFNDPGEVPVPPAEVRIRELRAEPYTDGRRVRVYLEVTPFVKRPDAEVRVHSPGGMEVANVSVIETIDPKMEMTLHLKGEVSPGVYDVEALVFYRENEEEGDTNGEQPATAKQTVAVVDQTQITFEIP